MSFEDLLGIREKLSLLGKGNVRIIAVSKTHEPGVITEYLRYGQIDYGENRVNEAAGKFPLVDLKDLTDAQLPVYHHIGPLQSGSARQIPGLFSWVHGASSESALSALEKACKRDFESGKSPAHPGWPVRYLAQIRLTDEETKTGGVSLSEFENITGIANSEYLSFQGFMTMGPQNNDPVETREVFHQLREIRDRFLPGGELSMGMSSDWEIAVSEGATMIRLGTVIFGKKQDGPWKG